MRIIREKYILEHSDEFAHFGIKGMKWGQRRYQNKDGSLTPAGKKRYNQSSNDVKKLSNYTLKKTKVKLGGTPADKYEWFDDAKKVAEFKTWNWWDGKNISDLEINKSYRGNKLSYQLLDYAVKQLGVENLSVEKTNKIAKHVYDKYGFETLDDDDKYYYMSINKV